MIQDVDKSTVRLIDEISCGFRHVYPWTKWLGLYCYWNTIRHAWVYSIIGLPFTSEYYGLSSKKNWRKIIMMY